MWYIVAVLVLGFLALAAWPFYVESGRPEITDQARARATGEFVQLSQGRTHYRWVGPARGPVAVVVHGLSTPMIAMDDVAEGLGALGYRVLMYDLYGRGLSDAPKGRQDRRFFLQQLSELCDYHRLRDEVTIAGYSMGGAIATAFAVENTYLVKRVILLASAGLATHESRFSRFCRRVPLLGRWVHGMFAHGRMLRSIPDKGSNKQIDMVVRAQRRELDRRGYLPAVLSSRRGMLSEVQEAEHRKLGRKGIPVVAIWGRKDPVISLRSVGLLADWNRNARQEMVDDADHGLPYTHPEPLMAALGKALRG